MRSTPTVPSRSLVAGPLRLLVTRSVPLLLAALLSVPADALAQGTLPANTAAAVDEVFADIDPTGPGCAAGVIADHELVYGKGFGTANLDYGIPITTGSVFYLGSVGKQFTAAALVHAAREGHLALDDEVQRWIPELPEYERPITLRHLVHHTSGIRDYLELARVAGWSFDAPHSNEEILELLARQRATNFPTGEEYLYSNSGYFLLAEVVERATGRSLREYAEAEILGPLGMDRTRIHDDRREPMPDRVVGYEIEDGRIRMNHAWNFDQVGSGGVWSSVEDLVHWDRNFYTEDVGGTGFTDQLLERGVLAGGDTIPYAFGIGHGEYRGLPRLSHGGSLAGFRSHLLRFPEERTTVTVLCNFPSSDPGTRALRVADAVLADRLAPPAAPVVASEEPGDAAEPPSESAELTPAQLDAFVGHWRASIGVDVEIRRDGEDLVFLQGQARLPVTVVSEEVLRLEPIDAEMTFSRKSDGTYDFQDVEQGGETFTAERFDPAADVLDYSTVAGSYYSEEVDVTWRLFEEEGALMVEAPGLGRARLALQADNRALAPGGVVLNLERDVDGQVVAFTFDRERVRGVRFERTREDGT